MNNDLSPEYIGELKRDARQEFYEAIRHFSKYRKIQSLLGLLNESDLEVNEKLLDHFEKSYPNENDQKIIPIHLSCSSKSVQ